MEVSLCLLLLLLPSLASNIYVQAQDQSGFISLDCGSPKDTSYVEKTTNLSYVSDAAYIETGIGKGIKQEYRTRFQQQAWYVRSFPDGARNCYALNLSQGDEYLIRAGFVYGNYDDLDEPPKFDLYIGANRWTTVTIQNATTAALFEMVHVVKSDRLHVCLVKTGSTTPFINALELRPLKNTTYTTQTGSLGIFLRPDIGSTSQVGFRFGVDPLDRFWVPYNDKDWTPISTNNTVNTNNDYQPPQLAMRTGSIPTDPDQPMNITLTPTDTTTQYYVYMHVAELQELKSNESREFEVFYNGNHLYGPFSPVYLTTSTIFTPRPVVADANGQYEFSIRKTGNSTLPPLLNAVEIYTLILLPQAETQEKQVNAVADIKRTYELSKISWQGDPCVPVDYRWEGLNCSQSAEDPPFITSLNLSSSGLRGEIASSISDLANLEILDLSDNNLTGGVPEFLAKMSSLRVINLSRNKLNGSVPASLLEREKSESLTLSVDGNPDLCTTSSCASGKKKKSSVLVPVVASVASVLVLGAALAAFFITKHKKNQPVQGVSYTSSGATPLHLSSGQAFESRLVTRNKRFTYTEVMAMTNNFQRILGRGGFGVVYHGTLDGEQVAVKMLTQASAQGYKQFKAEVELLLRVHHRNLTSLVGYCDENNKLALMYEYMANGDLKEHLSGKRGHVLTWESRVKIATEAAQGLEYLHNGCRPPIVHRDVKTTNILINEHFQAKLSDFGLSRSFPGGNETHVSTVVAGTPGYLDPEYYRTNWLTEKSDVYSFGIALLEVITNRPVIDQSREKPLISEWVGVMLSGGDITSVVDPKLLGDYDTNSVWKAVEIAMGCANPSAARRPTMTQVVVELNECLAAEAARNQVSRETGSTNGSSIELSMNFTTEMNPRAR